MLPFLAKKKDAGIAGIQIKTRTPDAKPEDENDESASKEACGQAILDAIHSGDALAVANAMQDMYDMCQSGESESNESSSNPSPHSYDAQNRSAAKENE